MHKTTITSEGIFMACSQKFLRASVSVAVLVLLLGCVGLATAAPDVFDDVPETTVEGYVLVYTLPIENQAGYTNASDVPYSVDNSAGFTAPFDRIAYYLELDFGNGLPSVFVYASMDAFTEDIQHIGLPVSGNGVVFQQIVSNMNVVSNSPLITTGTGIATGNIEFWSNNYAVQNQINIPNASSDNFDFGDTRASGGNYGSFQIHNYGASQTIMAYNQWGGINPAANGDLGIGNGPNPARTDWTFSANTGQLSCKEPANPGATVGAFSQPAVAASHHAAQQSQPGKRSCERACGERDHFS